MGLFRKGYGTSEHSRTEALSAYLDGQLSPAKRQALESHLGTCGQCQWNLQTLRTTVQWTRDLPVVPVPRTFTIPVPAKPAREPRWRWSLPVLQGATAVVALLFVFSVAGDLMLRGVLPASAPYVPRGEVVMQEAPAAEDAAEAPLEVEAALPSEPTLVAELAVSEESPAPLVEAAPATDWLPEGEKALATEALEARALGATGIEAPAEEAEVAVTLEKEAASDMVAAEPPPMPAAEAVGQPTSPAKPTPTSVPATLPPTAKPTPTAVSTTQPLRAEPTVVASYHAPVQPAAEDEAGRAEGPYQPSLIGWLGVAEVVFGVTFVLLATLTIALTLRRLRTR